MEERNNNLFLNTRPTEFGCRSPLIRRFGVGKKGDTYRKHGFWTGQLYFYKKNAQIVVISSARTWLHYMTILERSPFWRIPTCMPVNRREVRLRLKYALTMPSKKRFLCNSRARNVPIANRRWQFLMLHSRTKSRKFWHSSTKKCCTY